MIVAPSFLKRTCRENAGQKDSNRYKRTQVGWEKSIFKVTECTRTQEPREPLLQQAEFIILKATVEIESFARPVSS